MGSGKSTLGALLAERIGYEWTDLDTEIERIEARSIADIFRCEGEEAFRLVETEVLKSAGSAEKCVLSLGGGALEQAENRAFVLRSGILVYLYVGLEELTRRLARSPETRPLLSDGSGRRLTENELFEFLQPLFDKRQATYEKAHIILDINGLDVSESGDALYEAIRDSIAGDR